MEQKIKTLREQLVANQLDGLLVTNLTNIKYLTNFAGSNALVYVDQENLIFMTDFRYQTVAAQVVGNGFDVKIIDRGLTEFVEVTTNAKKIGIEDSASIAELNKYSALIDAEIIPTSGIIEKLRMIKTDTEIKKIKNACNLICDAVTSVTENIVVGKTTEKETSLAIYSYGITHGTQGNSFESIVASGANSALPHAECSEKIINNGDFLTIDCGFIADEYCSDTTRTYQIGDDIDPKLKEIYEIVLEANKLVIEQIKPGMRCCDVDKIARDYITGKGYGEYFGHGLGHSFGLEVHEAPYCNTTDTTILEAGMLMTVEPGIYLPELGGVRIEDDILITENGCEVLTSQLNKEFTILK